MQTGTRRTIHIVKQAGVLTIAAALLLCTGAPASAKKAGKSGPSCAKVKAAMEESGGAKSADEIATQLKTSPKHVHACMEGGGKHAKKKGASGGAKSSGSGAMEGAAPEAK
jgi:hypothetical protein